MLLSLPSRLLLATLGLSALLPSSLASLTFSLGNSPLLTVPSQDFFQASSHPFARTGFPLPIIPSPASTECLITPEVPDTTNATLMGLQQKYSESIFYVLWDDAEAAGCQTFHQLAQATLNYNQSLGAAGIPSGRTLVIILPMKWSEGPVPGNPSVISAYRSVSAGSDGPITAMPIVLITSTDYATFATRSRALQIDEKRNATAGVAPRTAYFTVLQEAGPWNDVFMDVQYQAVYLCFLLVNILFLLHACSRLIPIIVKRQLAIDLRNGVFLLGLLSSGLYMGTFIMRVNSFATIILQIWSSYLGSLAFQMILYLWSDVLMQIRPHRFLQHFRFVIAFATFCVTLGSILSTIRFTIYSPSATFFIALNATTYIAVIGQLIIGSIFLAYSFQFRRRRTAVKVSPETYRALSKLTHLAWIAYFSYVGLAITNLPPITQATNTPIALAITCPLIALFSSARSFALLSILGVRVPNKSTTVGASAMAGASHGSDSPTYQGYVSQDDRQSYKAPMV